MRAKAVADGKLKRSAVATNREIVYILKARNEAKATLRASGNDWKAIAAAAKQAQAAATSALKAMDQLQTASAGATGSLKVLGNVAKSVDRTVTNLTASTRRMQSEVKSMTAVMKSASKVGLPASSARSAGTAAKAAVATVAAVPAAPAAKTPDVGAAGVAAVSAALRNAGSAGKSVGELQAAMWGTKSAADKLGASTGPTTFATKIKASLAPLMEVKAVLASIASSSARGGAGFLGGMFSGARQEFASIRAQLEATQQAADFTRATKSAGLFGRTLSGIGSQAKFLAVTLGTLAIGGGIISGVKSFVDFDKAMSSVKANAGATAEEFQQLRDAAKTAGVTTVYTAAESADALDQLVKAGLSAKDAIKTLSPVLTLAQAGEMGIADAAEIAVNTMGMFGISVDRASSVVDILAATALASTTDVKDLAESFKYAGPTAAAFGVSINEVSGALGTLATKGGIKGSAAGTAIRSIVNDMKLLSTGGATKRAQETLNALGISMEAIDPQRNGFTKVLQTLKEAGATQADLLNLFQERGAGPASTLITNLDELQKQVDATVNSVGKGAAVAKTRTDNLWGDLMGFVSAVQGAWINLGEMTNGGLRTIVQFATGVVRTLQGVASGFGPMDEAIRRVAETLKYLGVVAAGVGTFLALKAGVASLTALISNPFLAAIGAAVAALVYFWDKTVTIGDQTSSFGNVVQATFEVLAKHSSDLVKTLGSIYENVRSIVVGVYEVIGQTFTKQFFRFAEVAASVVTLTTAMWGLYAVFASIRTVGLTGLLSLMLNPMMLLGVAVGVTAAGFKEFGEIVGIIASGMALVKLLKTVNLLHTSFGKLTIAATGAVAAFAIGDILINDGKLINAAGEQIDKIFGGISDKMKGIFDLFKVSDFSGEIEQQLKQLEDMQGKLDDMNKPPATVAPQNNNLFNPQDPASMGSHLGDQMTDAAKEAARKVKAFQKDFFGDIASMSRQAATIGVAADEQDRLNKLIDLEIKLRDAGIKDMDKYRDAYIKAMDEVKKAQDAANKNFELGFGEGLREFGKQATNLREQAKDLATGIASDISGTLKTFLKTGKLDLGSLITNIGDRLIDKSVDYLVGSIADSFGDMFDKGTPTDEQASAQQVAETYIKLRGDIEDVATNITSSGERVAGALNGAADAISNAVPSGGLDAAKPVATPTSNFDSWQLRGAIADSAAVQQAVQSRIDQSWSLYRDYEVQATQKGDMLAAPALDAAIKDRIDQSWSAVAGATSKNLSAYLTGPVPANAYDKSIPASIRTNNPGAMWYASWQRKYGALGGQNLADGTGQNNNIGMFPTPEAGAAAQLELLQRYGAKGWDLSKAISTWSGGNNSAGYTNSVAGKLGMSPDTSLSSIMSDQSSAVALAKYMSRQEAGRNYPMSDQQWGSAWQLYQTQNGSGGSGSQLSASAQQAQEAVNQLAQSSQTLTTSVDSMKSSMASAAAPPLVLGQNTAQLSISAQTAATAVQQASAATGSLGSSSTSVAAQMQAAGSTISAAGQEAASAASTAGNASNGFNGLKSDLSGLLGPLNQVVPGLGSFAQSILNFLGMLFDGGGKGNGGGLLSGLFSLFHGGGIVGQSSAMRVAPVAAFANAPRYHSGLKNDEFASILQRGERVLTEDQSSRSLDVMSSLADAIGNRKTNKSASGIVINQNISTPDADSFRRSQGQTNQRLATAVMRSVNKNR